MAAMGSKNVVNGTNDVSHEETGFTSYSKHLDIKGRKITVRMLRMNGATMIFICPQGKESLDEMGIAFQAPGNDYTASSTTLFGPEYSSNSQRLADLWSRRYKSQFIVSCNIQTNDIDGSLVEKAVSEWVSTNVHAKKAHQV